MKSKEEIVEWLLENCLDCDGNVDISGLDFGEFKGNIYKSMYKCKGDIYQGYHENKGSICQSSHENEGDIYQNFHKNKGDIDQRGHKNKGDIDQRGHKNKGFKVYEGEHKNVIPELSLEELKNIVGYDFKLKGE